MLNIEPIKSLFRIEENDTDVAIYLGWICIATIEEEDGRWYPDIQGSAILSFNGAVSKQAAIDAVILYIKKV